MNHILNPPPTAIAPSMVESVRSLFPQEPSPSFILSNFPISADQFLTTDMTEFERTLAHMNKSAPGLSGVSNVMLQDLLRTSIAAKTAVFKVVNALLEGKGESLKLLRLARLVTIPKPDGRVRPIGLNEGITNITSTIALGSTSSEISSALHPLDFGFSKPGGAEAVIHIVRTVITDASRSDRPVFVLQLDVTNAFNSVFRSSIFDVASAVCPRLLPYLKIRYSDMFLRLNTNDGNHVDIMSSRGVSQGCPLSPPLFQLAISKALVNTRAICPMSPSYLDDMHVVASSPGQIVAALQTLTHDLQLIGLDLNIAKCRLLVMWPQGANPTNQDVALLHSTGVPIVTDGLVILGSPVGTAAFERHKVESIFNDITSVVAKAQNLITRYRDSPAMVESFAQKFFQLIRYCICTRATYTLRTVHPVRTQDAARQLDKTIALLALQVAEVPTSHRTALLGSLHAFLATPSDNPGFSTLTRVQAILDRFFLKRGGLGLFSAFRNCWPAYVGSMALVIKLVQNATGLGLAPISSLLDFPPTLLGFLSRTGIGSTSPVTDATELLVDPSDPQTGVQAKLSLIVQKKLHCAVDAALTSFPLELAYFRSASTSVSALWLHSNTRFPMNLVPDATFMDAIYKQVGLEAPLPPVCSSCREPVPHSREDHAISCSGPRGASGTAGGHVERAVLHLIRRTGVEVVRKPPLNTLPGFEPIAPNLNGTKTYGDFLVTTGGTQLVVDVTFSTCPSRRPVETKELQKVTEYRRNRRRPDLVVSRFVPIAVDAAGKRGDRMVSWLSGVLKRRLECEPSMRRDIRKAFRQGQEAVSMAVLKAMSAYYSIYRHGFRDNDTA